MAETVTNMVGGLYRRIYAGFLTGKRINAVSLGAEAWFWRLHAIADDFGNLPGDPMVLQAFAAPKRDLSIEDVSAMTAELERQIRSETPALLVRYEHDGDSYLHIDGFEIRQPAGKNGRRIQKYPIYLGVIQGNPGESKGIRLRPGNPAPPIPIPIPNKDLPAAPVRPRKPRTEKQVERDALWDAVVAEWKLPVSTPTQQGRVGKLVGEFKGAGATPLEIGGRRRAIAAAWGPEKATPESTAKHWGEFGTEATPASVAENRRKYVEAESERYLRGVHEHDATIRAEREAKRTAQEKPT